ncbi:MAG: efflux RND transporter periplasmic adaptor subunit [Armatimonadetes bacterium]|nr:efflux RND transporter periplasmic adaptor subunit [Armatimonadota bacterium]
MRALVCWLLTCLLAGCAPAGGGSDRKAGAPVVGVARPVRHTLGDVREYTGTVESLNQVSIVPQVPGQLEAVMVEVGDAVSQGQVLATVDDSQLEAQVSQARASAAAAQAGVQTALANLAVAQDQTRTLQQAVSQAEAEVIEAQAAVDKAQTQVQLAERTLERVRVVAAKDLIARQVVDQSEADAQSAAADLKAARAQHKARQRQLEQARLRVKTAARQEQAAQAEVETARAQAQSLAAALEAVEVRRSYTRVTSPLDGVVVARSLDPGAYVTPGDSGAVVVVASLEQLRIIFAVGEADLESAKPGQEAEISFDALEGGSRKGSIRGVAGGLDPSTRTMRVEARLAQPEARLRPGMLARLKLRGKAKNALTVPVQAVQREKDEAYVYLVGPENVVKRQTVKLSGMEGDVAILSSGLGPNDQVVVRGTDQVQEGKPVSPVEIEL